MISNVVNLSMDTPVISESIASLHSADTITNFFSMLFTMMIFDDVSKLVWLRSMMNWIMQWLMNL
ncbi:hypothetical protein X975_00528, partial [Stegodyphus mimosarum]